MAKKLLHQGHLKARLEAAREDGYITKSEIEFLFSVINNYEDLRKDALRYRAYMKRLKEAGASEGYVESFTATLDARIKSNT